MLSFRIEAGYIRNPITGRQIKRGGPTHKKVIKQRDREIEQLKNELEEQKLDLEADKLIVDKGDSELEKMKVVQILKKREKKKKQYERLQKLITPTMKQNARQFKGDIIQTVRYLNFDLLHVHGNLAEPTSDTDKITKQIIDYLQSRFIEIRGRKLNIVFGLSEINARYRTGEFIVNSLDDIREKLSDGYNTWLHDRQAYEDKELFDVAFFDLYITMNRGGCFIPGEENYRIPGINTREFKTMVYTPLNKNDNNCALHCFYLFKNAKFTRTSKAKITIMNDISDQMQQLRNELYHNKTDKIPFDELDDLCLHFDLNCNVYEVYRGKFKCIKKYDLTNSTKIVNLLLINGHYALITNPSILDREQCPTCKKYLSNIKAHKQKCKRCPICLHYYQGEHSKEVCNYKYNNTSFGEDKNVTICKHDEKYTCGENVIHFDFETINVNGVLQVYATAYSIDNGPVIIYKGSNSLNEFMNDLLNLNRNKKGVDKKRKTKYILNGYNSSRFDLYFIYKWLLDNEISVTHEIISDGAYKMIEFNGIRSFDLCLHLTCSLASACKNFGIDEDKQKSEFDHKLIQSWEDVDTYEKDWLPYLKLDIISLRELYNKYCKSVWDDFQLNAVDYMTVSSLGFKIWRTKINNKVKYWIMILILGSEKVFMGVVVILKNKDSNPKIMKTIICWMQMSYLYILQS
eukprot:Lithocolla_globosa_v1_NODE_322_length_4485_cov_1721.272460.p1 type:complete len:687 gc:universal NODE_322_length_4485_cov_1721.272460:352-2412(+)